MALGLKYFLAETFILSRLFRLGSFRFGRVAIAAAFDLYPVPYIPHVFTFSAWARVGKGELAISERKAWRGL